MPLNYPHSPQNCWIWAKFVLELHDFPVGKYVCAGAVFWPIWLIRLHSALYLDGDSDGFWELLRAFWADWVLLMLFGSIRLDDSGHSSTYNTNKPQSVWNAPKASPSLVEFHPNISQIWLEGNLLGPYSGPFFRVFGWFWAFQKKLNPSKNASEFLPNFRPFGEGEQNALESTQIRKFGCIRSCFSSGVTEV